MQPRIYTYKITFEEVPYYYYGSKKEKYYNQEYWGSPKTNKWCWELYTPKKQILELFDYTDEGYEECRRVEDRLIKPVLNDPWCLNEAYGIKSSLIISRKTGEKTYVLKVGIHGLNEKQRKENAIKAGKKTLELKVGVHNLSPEEKRKNSIKGGKLGGL